jgi:hypothetical protein
LIDLGVGLDIPVVGKFPGYFRHADTAVLQVRYQAVPRPSLRDPQCMRLTISGYFIFEIARGHSASFIRMRAARLTQKNW